MLTARTHVHTAYMQNDKDTNDEDAAAKVRKNLARRKHQMERHAADAAKKKPAATVEKRKGTQLPNFPKKKKVVATPLVDNKKASTPECKSKSATVYTHTH